MEALTKHSTANNSVLKIIITVLFIVLPFVGFFVGINYQTSINEPTAESAQVSTTPVRKPTPTPPSITDMANWKTYTNIKENYQLRLPLEITECDGTLSSEYPKEINDEEGERVIISQGPSCEDHLIIYTEKNQNDLSTFDFWRNHFTSPPLQCINNTECFRYRIFEGKQYKESFEIEPIFPDRNGFKLITKEYLGKYDGYDIYLRGKPGTILHISITDTAINNQILSTFKFLDQNTPTPQI